MCFIYVTSCYHSFRTTLVLWSSGCSWILVFRVFSKEYPYTVGHDVEMLHMHILVRNPITCPSSSSVNCREKPRQRRRFTYTARRKDPVCIGKGPLHGNKNKQTMNCGGGGWQCWWQKFHSCVCGHHWMCCYFATRVPIEPHRLNSVNSYQARPVTAYRMENVHLYCVLH